MRMVMLFGSAVRLELFAILQKEGYRDFCVVVPADKKYDASYDFLCRQDQITLTRLHKTELSDYLQKTQPELLFSVGWPYLLGKEMLQGPWLPLNIHPTLLPKYRGVNPWPYILMNCESESGITIHRIDEGMDSGPILIQEKFKLTPFDTYRSLKRKSFEAENRAILKALKLFEKGELKFMEQDHDKATSYPRRRKPEDSRIDPQKPLAELVDSIRACDPETFPAFFDYHGEKVCVRLWRPEKNKDNSPESL